uniref:Uncharacterized protein n=1 Tax=Sulfobacillus thermotolerans TaxID=338644 RepID=G5CJ96_9FIRM|nr:hypothetical protein [Sulfobacillus thermotolerans]AEP14374.1 hypothetical protein [Sulfobacillus thermotolerans]
MTPMIVGLILIATLGVFWIARHRGIRYRRFAMALVLVEFVGLVVTLIQLPPQQGSDWAGNLVASGTPRAWHVQLVITSQQPISRMRVQWTVPHGLPLPQPITETFGKYSGLVRWQYQWQEKIPAGLSRAVVSRKLAQCRIHVTFVSASGRHQTTYSIIHWPQKKSSV